MSVEIHMIPVKAGDATLILDQQPSKTYATLIDAGLSNGEVVSYLQKIGIYHLDLVIISHPDLDHIQGLIEIINNKFMSIGQLWCFDLSFLKGFIEDGTIPRPKQTETAQEIQYFIALRTLDVMDTVLTHAQIKGIPAFQVSDGHRFTLGNIYIEVLYPSNEFYNSLYTLQNIKKLLKKRWPSNWDKFAQLDENGNDKKECSAKRITARDQSRVLKERLAEYNEKYRNEDLGPLINSKNESLSNHDPHGDEEDVEHISISKIGSLYNNLSIVVKIHILGGVEPTTMLFPGDLSDWTHLVIKHASDLSANIFKYPHHGSLHSGISMTDIFYFMKINCLECHSFCHFIWEQYHTRCLGKFKKFFSRLFETDFYENSPELFAELIRPEHILIFPYPSQDLPNEKFFSPFDNCKLHANRIDPSLNNLCKLNNMASPHILKLDFLNYMYNIKCLTCKKNSSEK